MKISDFDFYLPKNLIALKPLEKRDQSRLLILHENGEIEHKSFSSIVEYLKEGDILLLNNTKVFPARILATKSTGEEIDILFVKNLERDNTWEVIFKGKFNGIITIGKNIKAEVWTEKGLNNKINRFLKFLDLESKNMDDFFWKYGKMPLPPYIERTPNEEDKIRYQTVYAEKQGSIAAPTAGLHFTEDLLKKIEDKGVLIRKLTLHVGIGTFKPIYSESVREHKMDPEYFEIKRSLIDDIYGAKRSFRRIIAVGTTTTRAIEGYFSGKYSVINSELSDTIKGMTDIFIYPEYKFKVINSLVTNFHLPRSTPLMLLSAFCGFENMIKAYNEAVKRGYRFFSYGDAMLVLKDPKI